MKIFVANKNRKKDFKGDCLQKPNEARACITISVNAKFRKKSAKINFTALGASEDFKIFD